jgi:cytosine/adenosine deaminase-related metal-dependent hydrolase
MSAILIDNAAGIFTGLPGAAMRRAGQIRIRDGVIVAIGALAPEPGEERLDARGGMVYPGLVSTHHHLLQSVHKGTFGDINQPKPEKYEITETATGFDAETIITVRNPPTRLLELLRQHGEEEQPAQ